MIVQVPFTPLPSAAVAVMVTVPAVTAVTTPLVLSIVATFGLDDSHVTFLFVALLGSTVAVKVIVCPFIRLLLPGFMVILFTGTTEGFTVT